MIYKDSRKIYASLCNTKPALSVIAIFQIVEDAVTNLMGELKIDGITTMKKYNAMWVFAKNRIKFLGEATWNDEIEINSFISLITPAKLVFDTAIFCKGKMIAYSKSEACAVDKETKTIRRTSTVGVDERITTENALENVNFKRLFIDKNKFCKVGTKTVTYTNLDYLHHTNNVEYVRMLLDTFQCKQLEEQPIKEIEIAYKNQSFENDCLDISTFNEENNLYYLISRGDIAIVEGEIIY